MKIHFYVLLAFSLSTLRLKAQTWEALDLDDFNQASYGATNYTHIANGTPYIIYFDGENGNRLTVKKRKSLISYRWAKEN